MEIQQLIAPSPLSGKKSVTGVLVACARNENCADSTIRAAASRRTPSKDWNSLSPPIWSSRRSASTPTCLFINRDEVGGTEWGTLAADPSR